MGLFGSHRCDEDSMRENANRTYANKSLPTTIPIRR